MTVRDPLAAEGGPARSAAPDPRLEHAQQRLPAGLLGHRPGSRRQKRYLDTWFSRARRARPARPRASCRRPGTTTPAASPSGFRSRENYFGRFEQNLDAAQLRHRLGERLRREGRRLLRAVPEPGLAPQRRACPRRSRPTTSRAASAPGWRWRGPGGITWPLGPTQTVAPHSPGAARRPPLPRSRVLRRCGTVELACRRGCGPAERLGPGQPDHRSAGGLAYNAAWPAGGDRSIRSTDQFYGRFTLEASARRALGAQRDVAPVAARRPPLRRRQHQRRRHRQAAADLPRRRRSAGAASAIPSSAPTARCWCVPTFNYHAPGGGNLRGFDPRSSAQGLVALNLELERTLLSRRRAKLFSRVALAAFGDAGHTFDGSGGRKLGSWPTPESGSGPITASARPAFITRVDFPLLVSRPGCPGRPIPAATGSASAGPVSFSRSGVGVSTGTRGLPDDSPTAAPCSAVPSASGSRR